MFENITKHNAIIRCQFQWQIVRLHVGTVHVVKMLCCNLCGWRINFYPVINNSRIARFDPVTQSTCTAANIQHPCGCCRNQIKQVAIVMYW